MNNSAVKWIGLAIVFSVAIIGLLQIFHEEAYAYNCPYRFCTWANCECVNPNGGANIGVHPDLAVGQCYSRIGQVSCYKDDTTHCTTELCATYCWACQYQ